MESGEQGRTPAAQNLPSRRSVGAPLLAVFLIGIAVWFASSASLRRAFVGDMVDDGQYLVGAQSLRAGTGYRLVSRPGEPVARKYPPGVSVMTWAALECVPGPPSLAKDQAVARGLMFACAIGLACGCRRLFALCGLDGWAGTLLALAVLYHPAVVAYVGYLNADLPFAALTTWLACRWAARWQRPTPSSSLAWAVDGLLGGLAIVVRGNGVTLPLAGLVGIMTARSGRTVRDGVAFLSPAVLIPALAIVLVASQAGGRDTGFYGSELSGAYKAKPKLWTIPLGNAKRVSHVLATEMIWPMAEWSTPEGNVLGRWPPGAVALCDGTLLLIVVGLWRLVPTRLGWAILTQAVLTVGLFCVWHFPFQVRFVLPLLPFMMVGFAAGAGFLLQPVLSSAIVQRTAGGAALIGGIVVLVGVIAYAHRYGGVRGRGAEPGTVEAFDAVRRLTAPGDVVFSGPSPELIYLNSGRQAAPLLDDDRFFANLPPVWSRLQRWLRTGGATYFLIQRPESCKSYDFQRAADAATPYTVKPLFQSSDGQYWLGQMTNVERQPETKPATEPTVGAGRAGADRPAAP